jgi:uncharacterized membrane protein
MSKSDGDQRETGPRTIAPSVVVWNTVVPALGLALILGASLLPAFAIAALASIVITVLLAPPSQRLRWSSWLPVDVPGRHRVLRGG